MMVSWKKIMGSVKAYAFSRFLTIETYVDIYIIFENYVSGRGVKRTQWAINEILNVIAHLKIWGSINSHIVYVIYFIDDTLNEQYSLYSNVYETLSSFWFDVILV